MPDEDLAMNPAAPASDAQFADQALTVEEFCARRSSTDRRVEMLGAFHADEIANKHFKDTESAFAARLEAFATKPA